MFYAVPVFVCGRVSLPGIARFSTTTKATDCIRLGLLNFGKLTLLAEEASCFFSVSFLLAAASNITDRGRRVRNRQAQGTYAILHYTKLTALLYYVRYPNGCTTHGEVNYVHLLRRVRARLHR